MRLIFMGTPDFAVPSLKALAAAGHRITGVVTQPDRPKGRGRLPAPPPVKTAAREAGLKVLQPEKIKMPEFIETLKQLSPELIAVAAFGQLLPREILALPSHGCINVHASLLPKYRGAAPIHWAVINGETETGVTVMQMETGLDSGDIILSGKIPIMPADTTGTVHDKLAVLGAELLVKAVGLIAAGKAPRLPQDHRQASFAPLLTKAVERIDWTKKPSEIGNLVRGLNPWPGAYTLLGDKVLKVWQARPCSSEEIPGPLFDPARKQAGEVLGLLPGGGLAVAAGGGCIALTEVQAAGSRRMSAADFVCGRAIPAGTVLGAVESLTAK